MERSVNATVSLNLTLEEASWLHSTMQNPLHIHCEGEPHPDNERAYDNNMRHRFFQATQPPLENIHVR